MGDIAGRALRVARPHGGQLVVLGLAGLLVGFLAYRELAAEKDPWKAWRARHRDALRCHTIGCPHWESLKKLPGYPGDPK